MKTIETKVPNGNIKRHKTETAIAAFLAISFRINKPTHIAGTKIEPKTPTESQVLTSSELISFRMRAP